MTHNPAVSQNFRAERFFFWLEGLILTSTMCWSLPVEARGGRPDERGMSLLRCDFPYTADLERWDGFGSELLGLGDSRGLEVRSITSDAWEERIWEADSGSCTRWESMERVVAAGFVSNGERIEVCF